MKITYRSAGIYSLSHDVWSKSLSDASRVIPGLIPSVRGVEGYSDAIEAACDWLEARGLFPVDRRPLGEDIPAENQIVFSPLLRDYQVEAVHFLTRRRRALLADDMGLGKTASAITAARNVGGKWVIVTPSYVRGVWSNQVNGGELKKWAGTDGGVILPSGIRPAEGIPSETSIVLIHYDILHAWQNEIIAWAPRGVIFDECHYLMSESSRRTQAAAKVARHCDFAWGLSGTPLTSRPRDLWGVLSTIFPSRFGDNFFRFGLRYCAGEKVQVTPEKAVWKFDGKSHADELAGRLRHLMLRRTKSEVSLQLPAKTRQVVYVEPKGKRRIGLTALDSSREALRNALDAAADVKIDDAEKLAQNHLETGSRVVLFTWRKSVAEFLANRLGGAFIHGGISAARRSKILFDSSLNCIAATIDSSATGIDLSRFDVAIFVELTYEPHELLQAESRLHRFGAKMPVLIQYVIARGTSDELVANAVVSKLETFESVIGGQDFDGGLKKNLTGSESDIMLAIYKDLGVTL